MAVYKRKGRKGFTVDWRDSRGKKHQKSFKTKSEANVYYAKVISDKSRGLEIDLDLGKKNVQYFYDSWIIRKNSLGMSPKTVETYSYAYRRFIEPTFGTVAVSKIRVIEVKNWITGMTLESGKKASSQTVHKAYTVFCMILDNAVEVDAVRVNAARQIKTHSKESVLPKNEMKTLPKILEIPNLIFLADKSCDYRPMILFMGILGPRVCETAGLKVKDFDLEKRKFTISRNLSPVKGSLVEGPTKNNKSRTIDIPQILFPELSPLIEGRDPDEYVFLSPMGKPLNSQNFNKRVWRKLFDGTNIERVRVHDLRHTAASLWISTGATAVETCQLLGHSDPAFTLRVYSHLFKDDMKKVSDSVGELVSRAIIRENSKVA